MIFNAVNFKNINFLTTLFLISIILISWVYTIFGIGMDMSAWKMTLMEYNQFFVSDSTNKSPLIGANVIISETSLGAATDSDGRYNINQIVPGDYIISVSYMGYKSYKKNKPN